MFQHGVAPLVRSRDKDCTYRMVTHMRALRHSPLMFAALIMGHHFSISAFWNAARASGVCWPRGNTSRPISASRARTVASAKASTTAALSLSMTFLGVDLDAKSANQFDM